MTQSAGSFVLGLGRRRYRLRRRTKRNRFGCSLGGGNHHVHGAVFQRELGRRSGLVGVRCCSECQTERNERLLLRRERCARELRIPLRWNPLSSRLFFHCQSRREEHVVAPTVVRALRASGGSTRHRGARVSGSRAAGLGLARKRPWAWRLCF